MRHKHHHDVSHMKWGFPVAFMYLGNFYMTLGVPLVVIYSQQFLHIALILQLASQEIFN